MSWQGVVGHDRVVEWFRRCVSRNRLANSFLFVGPPGVGKRMFAERLAATLLCPHYDPAALLPCGTCSGCRQMAGGNHPDLLAVSKPADRNVLPIELFVGTRDQRMQEGLCHDIGLKPFLADRRVAIIDDAELMNEESANCLLKTLEEPPPGSVLILCATSEEQMLSTIRSRCQQIRFRPLSDRDVSELLLETDLAAQPDVAERVAAYAEGSLGRAMELLDEQLWQFRERLLRGLANWPLNSVELSEQALSFIDEAGREAVDRRRRARLVVQMAADFYRAIVRRLCGAPPSADETLAQAVDQAIAQGRLDVDMAVRCVERSLEAIDHIDRFVHQGAWLPCWLDDLARTTRPTAASTA